MRQAGDASAGAAGFAAGLDFAIPPLSYSKPPCMAHGNMLSNGKPKLGSNICTKKSCTSCGTVNTPQWREGPCGPRTLCNACGVKHLRHVRGHQRPVTSTGARKIFKQVATSRITKPQLCRVKTETGFKKKLHQVTDGSKQAAFRHIWPSNAEDCSQPSSESAGEVCWAPSQAAACEQQQDLFQMGTECAAAVNLLSMTRPQSILQHYANILPHNQTASAKAQASRQQWDSDAEMPTREPACVIKDYTNEQHSREALILQEHARSCAAARFEMHMAKREAAAADAAVSAVAQVLAAKQEAARKAQAAINMAERHLKQLIEQA